MTEPNKEAPPDQKEPCLLDMLNLNPSEKGELKKLVDDKCTDCRSLITKVLQDYLSRRRCKKKRFFLLSPTYAITLWCEKQWPEKGIKYCTSIYLCISVSLFFIVLIISNPDIRITCCQLYHNCNYTTQYVPTDLRSYFIFYLVLSIFSVSRIIESVGSLTIDAFSHLGKDGTPNENPSGFSSKGRVLQLIKNYVDITMQFGFIFYLMQKVNPCFLKLTQGDTLSVFDAVYFSAVTITTLGYGDIAPIHWTAKLLVVIELLCGLSLIVMVFAIYASQKDKE